MEKELEKLMGDKKIPLTTLFKRTFHYVKPELPRFLFALFLILINVGIDVVLPLIISKITTNLKSDYLDLILILVLVIGYFLLSLINQAFLYFESMILQKAGQKIIYNLRMEVFEHIENMSLDQLNDMPVGSLVTRVCSYTTSMSDLFTNVLVNVIRNVLTIVVVYVVMFTISYRLSFVLLGIVMFIFVITAIIKNKPVNSTAGRIFTGITILAVVLHTAALICRWYIAGHAPWSNAYESMIYIAWAGALAGLLFFQRSLLAIAATNFVAGITLFVANLGFMDPQIGTLVPVLKSYWLNIHVSVITASYSFFGLCFVLGIISMVLFILRSPKRAHIDQSIVNVHCINEISMLFGLGLLTIGTFLGGVWANESWGRYWGWDPKETWSLITVIAYTIILHARLVKKLNNPYIFSVLSTLGFYTVMMTYFGVNYYLAGMHSYASGEPIPIPTFLYVMVGLHIVLIAVSFIKRKLEMPSFAPSKDEE